MANPKKARKIGSPDSVDCAGWTRQAVQDWMDGYGPGGKKETFPSAARRIASGETLLRVATGCLAGEAITERLKTAVERERKDARKRRG